MGRQEVGYLPGDLDEKLAPWMAAVHDNLYALFADGDSGAARIAVEELIERDVLEMASITYLRGRSITGELVIIDEAQNLELPTLKVILTRMSRARRWCSAATSPRWTTPTSRPSGASPP